MRQRRHALYCLVVCRRNIVVKMPDYFVAAKEWRRLLHRFIFIWYGIPGSEIHDIEAMAGYVESESDHEDTEYLKLVAGAFAGENDALPTFDLVEWNPETKSFWAKRSALKTTQ